MARKSRKSIDVQKFGGVEDRGGFTEVNAENAPVKDVNYDLKDIEVQSKTNLESDIGEGAAAVIRCFTFGMNPQAFHENPPTKQELFNHHLKGIEMALWRDGLKVMTEVQPRLVVDEKNGRYQIFVSARPSKGHILPYNVNPQTLKQIAHG